MLPLRVELGRVVVPRTRLASFQPGAVVVLDSANEQEVDVVVGDQLIANGELVIHDGKVCVRITQFTIPNEQEPLRRAS